MDTEAVVFVYTGPGGDVVPRDVVCLRVDPSVMSIPANAFFCCKKLTEVELCEGIVEIGAESFAHCDMTKINIPNSTRKINKYAFYYSLQCPIRLHNGIESIGEYAFASCIFTNFRVPPLITVIPEGVLRGCTSTFSVEMPKNVTRIEQGAFYECFCLRNVAFPPNEIIIDDIFIDEEEEEEEGEDDDEIGDETELRTDLQILFGNSYRIISSALEDRFNELPIHSSVYSAYHQGALQCLITSGNELDPTGSQQDCLGMTPLHILACSSVHNLEMYHLIVEKYPANLITEDRWGATPLLYAFWGAAPVEIIEFLLDSYHLLYPDYVFNWTMMVETMGRCHTPNKNIESLLCAKQMHHPEQPLDWEYLLTEFASSSSRFQVTVLFQEQLRFLFMCGLSARVEALALKVWRDYVTNMINSATFVMGRDNSAVLREIRSKLAHFELKVVTTILELALWKMNMNEDGHQDSNVQSQDG